MDKCFIATSSEGQYCATFFMEVLDAILKQAGLDIECVLWREARGFSALNDATLTRLVAIGRDEIAYSIAFFTPDDLSTSRGQSQIVARDNVLFEYGLFLGMLGGKRSFAVVPQDEEGRNSIKLPSDICGIGLPRYKFNGFDCTKYSQRDFFRTALSIVRAIKGDDPPPDGEASTENPPIESKIAPRIRDDEDSRPFSSY